MRERDLRRRSFARGCRASCVGWQSNGFDRLFEVAVGR